MRRSRRRRTVLRSRNKISRRRKRFSGRPVSSATMSSGRRSRPRPTAIASMNRCLDCARPPSKRRGRCRFLAVIFVVIFDACLCFLPRAGRRRRRRLQQQLRRELPEPVTSTSCATIGENLNVATATWTGDACPTDADRRCAAATSTAPTSACASRSIAVTSGHLPAGPDVHRRSPAVQRDRHVRAGDHQGCCQGFPVTGTATRHRPAAAPSGRESTPAPTATARGTDARATTRATD